MKKLAEDFHERYSGIAPEVLGVKPESGLNQHILDHIRRKMAHYDALPRPLRDREKERP